MAIVTGVASMVGAATEAAAVTQRPSGVAAVTGAATFVALITLPTQTHLAKAHAEAGATGAAVLTGSIYAAAFCEGAATMDADPNMPVTHEAEWL